MKERVRVRADRKEHRGRPYRMDEDQIDVMITDYNEGMTQVQCAVKYHLSLSTVQRYIRQRR